jgi:hypothetical protein
MLRRLSAARRFNHGRIPSGIRKMKRSSSRLMFTSPGAHDGARALMPYGHWWRKGIIAMVPSWHYCSVMADTPTRDQNKFIVRFPDGMRDRIAEAAKASGRSMNAEIVYRLGESLNRGTSFAAPQAVELVKIIAEMPPEVLRRIVELRNAMMHGPRRGAPSEKERSLEGVSTSKKND